MRAFPILLLLLLTSTGQQQDFFPRIITIDGRLTRADYERLIEHEFQVPTGTQRIEIEYAVTGADRRTVVDLGLRGPSGLRGWSGGGKRSIFVSALGATQGYLPGPLEPGTWAVILGVPNIREGSDDTYQITVRLFDAALAPATTVRLLLLHGREVTTYRGHANTGRP